MRGGKIRTADVPVVRVRRQEGIVFGRNRLTGELGGPNLSLGAQVVGPRRVSLFKSLFQGDITQRRVRNRVRQPERLAVRQSNHPREHKFVDGELVLGRDQALLLGLKLHAGAQHVDARNYARLVLIHVPLVERLARLDLSADGVHAGLIRNHKKIGVGRSEHHQIAIALVRVLRRPFGLRRGLPVFDVGPIEDFLGEISAGIRYAERPHNRRDADSGKSKVKAAGLEVDLFDRAADARREVGQHRAQTAKARGVSGSSVLVALNQPKVVFQGAIERLFQRKLK